MVGYKFSENDWVTPFLVIFRSVREILLVTVFLEHHVTKMLNKTPVSDKNISEHNFMSIFYRSFFVILARVIHSAELVFIAQRRLIWYLVFFVNKMKQDSLLKTCKDA